LIAIVYLSLNTCFLSLLLLDYYRYYYLITILLRFDCCCLPVIEYYFPSLLLFDRIATTEMSEPFATNILRPSAPPIFNGSTNVRQWITRLNIFFKAYGAVDEETKFNFACSLLDGPAIDWWLFVQSEMAEGNRNSFVSYTEFVEELTNYFTPYSDIASAEKELAEIRQIGSVADYTKKFSQIMVRIHDMSDGERRRCFIRGLRPNTQKEIYRQCPKSYKEACRIAQLFDHASFQLFPQSKPVFRQFVSSPQNQATNGSRMEIDQINTNHPKRLTEAEKEYLIKNHGCFSCRKLGHCRVL